jgi:hypothetical protein
MSLSDLLTVAVIFVALPLSWLVAVLLWNLSRGNPKLYVLRAHAVAALAIAIIVTVFTIVFVNNNLAVPPPLDLDATKIITRGTILVVSTVSALYWLLLVWRSK